MTGLLHGRILALLLFGSTLFLAIVLVAWRANVPQQPTLPLALANRRHELPLHAKSQLIEAHSGSAAVPVFDPVLAYATYLDGPNGVSSVSAFFVDTNGNSYVGGSTQAGDFPTTTGVINPADPAPGTIVPAVGYQAAGYLSKLAPDGQSLIFSTYVQGISAVNALALDSAGNIFIAGPTACAPQTPCTNPPLQIPGGTSPFQPALKGIGILKLNSTATSILAATYLGGSGQDTVGGIAVDSDGSVYVIGSTTSNDFPLLNPIKPSLGAAGQNGFVTKLNSTLTTLGYSTYIGQDGKQAATAIAVDSSKNAYVAGVDNISAFVLPFLVGNAFVTKLNPAGSTQLYSVEPSGLGTVAAVVLDAQQNAWIAAGGGASSPNLGTCNSLAPNAIAARINSSGALSYVACLGVTGNGPGLTTIGLDSAGNVYTSGFGRATFTNPIDGTVGGGSAFVAAFQPSSSTMLFSSNIDGPSLPPGIGVDSTGNIYIAGTAGNVQGPSQLPTFPVWNALQPTPGSIPCDQTCPTLSAFLLKISPTDAPATAVAPGIVSFPPQAVGTVNDATLTITDLGSSPIAISNITKSGDDFSLFFPNNTICTTVAAAGGTCPITIQFAPTSAGTKTGTVVITDNSAGSPHVIQIVGVGGQGTAQLSPATLAFAAQTIGTVSSPQTVTLTNAGNLPLESIHIQASSQFDETNNCTVSLATNASCTINVTFNPTTASTATGTLTVTDSGLDSPQTVALTGTGQTSTTPPPPPPAIGLGVAPGGSTTATVAAGGSASYTLSIGGSGLSGATSLSCSGAPKGAVCTVPANVTLSATTPSTFNVSVTTTSRSSVFFQPTSLRLWLFPFLALALLAMFKMARTQGTPRRRRLVPALAIVLCACGGGGSSSTSTPPLNANGTPAGTYTIVITAKSGTTTQTQSLTLTVQ